MSSCHSLQDLELAAQDLWAHLPQDNIRCLINSMPERVAACIAAGVVQCTIKVAQFHSDSRRTLIWRAPGNHYHQEDTIKRHRYGGARWLVWEELFLVPELTCMFRVQR
ncbi:HTH_Tnp_Tc3_2 domain-containing protein [Trichonephila clavipes]|nr:HTH_Tnp_Tc3_2 domain-containing protein [Trichonephila clavipes]